MIWNNWLKCCSLIKGSKIAKKMLFCVLQLFVSPFSPKCLFAFCLEGGISEWVTCNNMHDSQWHHHCSHLKESNYSGLFKNIIVYDHWNNVILIVRVALNKENLRGWWFVAAKSGLRREIQGRQEVRERGRGKMSSISSSTKFGWKGEEKSSSFKRHRNELILPQHKINMWCVIYGVCKKRPFCEGIFWVITLSVFGPLIEFWVWHSNELFFNILLLYVLHFWHCVSRAGNWIFIILWRLTTQIEWPKRESQWKMESIGINIKYIYFILNACRPLTYLL